MNFKMLLFVLMCSLCTSLSAQKIVVKGVVQDSVTHQGEPYASVRIFVQGKTDKPVAMFVTSGNGSFRQEVKGVNGSYVLVVSAVGRKDVQKSFTLDQNSSADLGTLYISDNVKSLKGVTVTAQRPLVKMEVDKMSYSVENDVDAKTNSILDMLRKVPMVTVDGQDNITVNGSSSFKIYVNGKPAPMFNSNPGQILKNMPASVVRNIEVITNPGAKYDAEGTGGVLNIELAQMGNAKGDMNQVSATLRTMLSNRGVGGGAYLAAQQGKFSFSLNTNIGNNKMKDNRVTNNREQKTSSGTSYTDASSENTMKFNMKMANLSMSYEVDSLRLLSASLGVMGFDNNNTGNSLVRMSGGAYTTSGFGYTGTNEVKMNRYSINGSVDYQRSFAGHKNKMLTLSYLFSTTPLKNKSDNTFSALSSANYYNLTDRYSNDRQSTVEHTFQLDYTTPLNKILTFDSGMKYILRHNSSHSDYYNVKDGTATWDEANSVNYRHNNDILAAYTELSANRNKLGAKLGLRYEYTWQHVRYLLGKNDNFSTDYGNLVPSANFSYKISESRNIGLAYNMRISRPSIAMLSPYINKSDPTSISYGNTNLDCEKSHNINLVYNHFTMKWMVNLTLRETICDNAIQQYSFYEGNVLNTTYGNVAKSHQTGLDAFINWNASKNTRITLNGSGSYIDLRSSALAMSNNGWQTNIMLGLQQTLPLNIRMSLNLISSSRQYNLQGWSTGFNAVMGSLSRSFCKDKLNVSIMGMTPLSGERISFKSYSKGSDYINRSNTSLSLQSFMFSVSYSFGKNASVKKTRHTISNDDLKKVNSQTESAGTTLMGN